MSFDLDNAPAQKRTTEPQKKKEKKPATEVVKEQLSAATDAVQEKVAAVFEKAAPNEKKQAEKKSAATPNKEGVKRGELLSKQTEDAGEPQPSMIDLRVGKIVEISKHPDADSLYVEVSLSASTCECNN